MFRALKGRLAGSDLGVVPCAAGGDAAVPSGRASRARLERTQAGLLPIDMCRALDCGSRDASVYLSCAVGVLDLVVQVLNHFLLRAKSGGGGQTQRGKQLVGRADTRPLSSCASAYLQNGGGDFRKANFATALGELP